MTRAAAPAGTRAIRAPRVPFAMLVVALIVGGMCALLALNTASAANELSRHQLASRDADIAAQVQQLRNDVAASAAPGTLGAAAAALGMVPADNPAFLKVGPDGRVRLLGRAAPATAAPLPAPPPAAPSTAAPTPSTPRRTAAPSPSGAHATARPGGPPGRTPTPSSPAPSPSPTPTPTPTVTIPGGQR